MTSLAKKGLFFTDAHGGNVGFVEVNGEMIPLVIGDGSVVSSKDLTKPSYFEYDEPENEYEKPTNLEVFVDLYRHLQLGTKLGVKPSAKEIEDTLNFIKNDDSYTKHPWINPKTGKWAQDEFVEQMWLSDVKKTGQPKGIIPKYIITELQQRENLSPIAKELVDLMAEHCLWEQDVKKLAANRIEEIIAENDEKAENYFRKLVAQHKENKDNSKSRPFA